MRALLLWNLAFAVPVALWQLRKREVWRAMTNLVTAALCTFLWPLPPVPAMMGLVVSEGIPKGPLRRDVWLRRRPIGLILLAAGCLLIWQAVRSPLPLRKYLVVGGLLSAAAGLILLNDSIGADPRDDQPME
jgi:hypothetical protein